MRQARVSLNPFEDNEMEATGIALRIGETFFFTLIVIFVKLLADAVPLGQVVFFRSAVALIPLVCARDGHLRISGAAFWAVRPCLRPLPY